VGLIIGIIIMALLSQSQSDNMETIVARIKKQALEAQQELVSSSQSTSKGVMSSLRPKARPESITQTDIVNNTISRLRDKANLAIEEQPEILLDVGFDVEAFTSKPAVTETVSTRDLRIDESVGPKARPNEPEVKTDAVPTMPSSTESNGLMSSLRPKARPDNIIEDIQLQQDIDIDPMVIAKPVLKGEPIPFSEGSVKGLVNTYTVNGVDRSIIDVGQTTVSESYYSSRPRTKIDPQNVVMHYTATEYSGGVRHYMNSFVGRNNVTAAFLVDRSGKIYQTFDPTVKGAHVHGSRTRNPNQIITNSNSIGVEVVATEQNPPSAKQLEASSWLTDYITAQYGTSRVVAHPQANVHKGDIEGFDIVNHWRKGKGLPELTVSEEAIENLLTLAPSRSLRPQKRPN